MKNYKQIIKNILVRFKFYHSFTKKETSHILVFFLKNGYPQKHPGFVDRLKAIVSIYYIAKQNGYEFKLVYDIPYPLEEYLEPNRVMWKADNSEISYSLLNTRLLCYSGKNGMTVLDKKILQYHCYYYDGLNVLRELHDKKWEQHWNELFHDLFKMSDKLKKLTSSYLPNLNFIAVHVRFVNALENFEKGYEQKLTMEQQEDLVCRCITTLSTIKKKENEPIYVFSDSSKFLLKVTEVGYNVLPINHIGHISFKEGRQVYEKMLIDFFVMSKADKIYSIQGEHLYNSVFSQYAAIIENKPYVIENLD